MDTGIVQFVPGSWPGGVVSPSTGFADSLIPQGVSFFSQDGKVIWERVNTSQDYKRLFDLCAPLGSVITRKASAFANGVFETVNPNTGNYLRGQYKEWDALWDYPNVLQSRTQFLTQLYIYLATRGWCYAMPMYSAGFEDRPNQIWLLPPSCLDVEPIRKPILSMKRGDAVRRVWFNYQGERTELDESKLILFTDNGSPLDPITWLPEGRIKALQYPVTNLISALEARAVLIQRRGAIGILSNSSTDAGGVAPMPRGAKEALQADYRSYGLSRDQWQVIITDAALKWQPMSLDVKQLGLHEEYLSCIKDIYDKYGFPFPLSSHTQLSAESNVENAWSGLYQDAIIPEANSITDQLNHGLKAEQNKVKFIVSYDHISYLQKSEEEKGRGRKAMNDALQVEWDNGLITRNMWLEQIGRDTVKGNPEFDKYKWELTTEQQQTVTDKNMINEPAPTN